MIAVDRERYLARLRRLGQGSFEARLDGLFDPGSWALMNGVQRDAAWERALVVAKGLVGGRPTYAYVSHAAVLDGSFGAAECEAAAAVFRLAAAEGVPVVGLLQSTGARAAEGHPVMAATARMFLDATRLSGAAPHLVACLGPCLGAAAYLAAVADFCWLLPGRGFAATTSPAVLKVATGENVSLEALGGAELHATESGLAHFVVPDEASALAQLRQVLGCLTGVRTVSLAPVGGDPARIVPQALNQPYEVRKLIEAVVDAETFLEVHPRWGSSIVTGFARLAGRAVGLVANQPRVRGGVLDTTAARKAARFIQAADAHGVPLIYLVDVPGIMVGTAEERSGVLDAGGLLFHAVDTDVARIALVTRKCFGGAFVLMQARAGGGDYVLAYPQAAIAVAGPEASFAMLYGKTYQTHPEAEAYKAELLTQLREEALGAQSALASGLVDELVDPGDTRQALLAALDRPVPLRERPPRRRPVFQL